MKLTVWLTFLSLVFTGSFLYSAMGSEKNDKLAEIAAKYGGAKTDAGSRGYKEEESQTSGGYKEDADKENAEEANRNKKRIAVIFSQTQLADYNGSPREDPNICFRVGNFIHVINALKRYGGLSEDPMLLAGKNLVKEKVENMFDQIAKMTKPGDEIFIYWEGHGGQGGGVGYDLLGEEADNQHEYFVMSDYRTNPESGIIRDDQFGALITETLKDRKVMLFLEVCHSGGLLQSNVKSFQGNQPKVLKNRNSLEGATTGNVDYTDSITLFKNLYRADTKSVSSGNSIAAGIVKGITSGAGAGTKDIGRDTPNLAVICSCSENESSYCGVAKIASAEEFDAEYTKIDEDEHLTVAEKQLAMYERLYLSFPGSDGNHYPISPSVCALVAVMQDEKGEFRKDKECGRFSDVAQLMKTFLPKNAARISNFESTQVPDYFTTIPDICITPAK